VMKVFVKGVAGFRRGAIGWQIAFPEWLWIA
jgi:hypothetical protein